MRTKAQLLKGVVNVLEDAYQASKAGKLEEALAAKPERALPLRLARATPKTPQELAAHAERVGRQMLGEHVRSGRPKETTNLAGRSLRESERVKQLEYELSPIKDVPESQVHQSRIGDINVAFPGDYTLSDVVLKTLGGRPVGSAQQGGSRYGLGKMDEDIPLFWASSEGPAKLAQNKITDVANLFEPERVMAHHLAMGPVATNFAQHFADANLRAIDYSKLRKKDMDLFDSIISGGYTKKNQKTGEVETIDFPNWPGIRNPEVAYEEMKRDPELRKWFNSRMKTPEVTEATNMPNSLDVQWAITSPDLRNMEVNLTGHSVGEMVPGASLTDTAEHETYSRGIQGLYRGHQEALTPFVVSFPDAAQHIASTKRPQDFTGTIQKVFPHQIVDQQYLDELGQYQRLLERVVTGKKKGGSIEANAGRGMAGLTRSKQDVNPKDVQAMFLELAASQGMPFAEAGAEYLRGNLEDAKSSAAIDAVLSALPVAGVAAKPVARAVKRAMPVTKELLHDAFNAAQEAGLIQGPAYAIKADHGIKPELAQIGVTPKAVELFLKYRDADRIVGNDPYLSMPSQKAAKTRAFNNLINSLGGVDAGRSAFSRMDTAYSLFGEEGLLLKNAEQLKDVLPAAERQANLEKFLEESAVKTPLYHATPQDFSVFKPGGDNTKLSGPAIWMSPSKEFQPAAHNIRKIPNEQNKMYGNESNKFSPGTNVMPVHASIKNPLVTTEKTWKEDFQKFGGGSPWTLTQDEVDKIKDVHDGIMYYDKNGILSEVIAFEPTQIKSALGNVGSFNPKDPDITKAKGGKVETNAFPYGLRHDSELPKGKGYFGPMTTSSGDVMTEYSSSDDAGDYPLVVPTLTADEIRTLLSNGKLTEQMLEKAQGWADARRKMGKSPFAGSDELRLPVPKKAGGSTTKSVKKRSKNG
jgi:hypothetical protein